MDSLNSMTRASPIQIEFIVVLSQVKCGFATVHDVNDGSLEDRMESFFLSETVKYLYLVTFFQHHFHTFIQLFDIGNPVNTNQERLIFSTEGHIFPISAKLRARSDDISSIYISSSERLHITSDNPVDHPG